MAEGLQTKSDQPRPTKSDQPRPNPSDHPGAGLVPLNLPPGVTSDTAAGLTRSILLRRAYCSSRPWERWILLASLKVLHGHAAPTLDPVSLHLLQETPSEKSADHNFTDDAEEEPDTPLTEEEVKKSVLRLEGENAVVKKGNAEDENKVEIKCNLPKRKCKRNRKPTRPRYIPPHRISNKNSLSQGSINPPKYHAITVDKNTTNDNGKSPPKSDANEQNTRSKTSQKLSNMPLKKDQQYKVSSAVKVSQTSLKKPSCSKDKGIGQVNQSSLTETSCIAVKISETCSSCKIPTVAKTSEVLGIDETKEIKMHHFQQTERGVQTETWNSVASLTESTGTQTNFLSYASVDKGVQTILVVKKDKSTNCVYKFKKRSKESHPEWKMIALSCTPVKKHRDDDTKKKDHCNGQCETKLDDSDVDGNGSIDNFLFHGHPIVKGKMMPVDIPLNSLAGPCDPALLDPRLLV